LRDFLAAALASSELTRFQLDQRSVNGFDLGLHTLIQTIE
jgi:hypothetical protein